MGFIGVFGGLTLAILGWFFGRHQAKKKNGLDEMRDYIFMKARSLSWYFTVVAIYVLLSLALFEVQLNLMPALSILLFVHMASWGISAIAMSIRLSTDPEDAKEVTKKKRIMLSGLIGSFFLIFFTIMSIVTDNLMFLIVAIPPVLLTTLTTIFAPNKKIQKH